MEAKRLSHDVWKQIQEAISKSQPRSEIMYGEVVKRDMDNRLVWIKDLGDQPIPIVGWRMEVDFYDATTDGPTPAETVELPMHVVKKTRPVRILMPEIGDVIVVLRQLGVRRLPKALGIILSTNFEDV